MELLNEFKFSNNSLHFCFCLCSGCVWTVKKHVRTSGLSYTFVFRTTMTVWLTVVLGNCFRKIETQGNCLRKLLKKNWNPRKSWWNTRLQNVKLQIFFIFNIYHRRCLKDTRFLKATTAGNYFCVPSFELRIRTWLNIIYLFFSSIILRDVKMELP